MSNLMLDRFLFSMSPGVPAFKVLIFFKVIFNFKLEYSGVF